MVFVCVLDGCVYIYACSDWWVHLIYIHVASYIMLTRVVLKIFTEHIHKVNILTAAAVHVFMKCCNVITIVVT